MRKIKIAVVTTFPPGKGSLNEYAYHFIRYLRQKNEIGEITLLVDELSNGEKYRAENIPGQASLKIIPCWRFGSWKNTPRILKTLRKEKPDVVLFNIQFASFGSDKVTATLGLMAPALVRAIRIPTVVLLHNIMETVDLRSAGFASNPIIEKIIRAFGYIVTRMLLTSNIVALTIPKYVEILEKKYKTSNVLLAPHGSFNEVAPPSNELPAGPRQIMTFGKFGTYKKIDLLIEAFKELKTPERGALELVVAGTDSPNAAGYLDNMRKEYSTVSGIRYTGYVPEEQVATIFGDAAVVVFPYNSTTGSSGVLHQAGEYGKAVVLPRLGDFAEVITEEGYTGEFFEPESSQSLAVAIAKVLDNPERSREIGAQNYVAAQGLPIAEVVDWYILHIQGLLVKSKNRTGRLNLWSSRPTR